MQHSLIEKWEKIPNIFFCPSTKQFVQVSPSKENQNPADRTCNLQQIALNLCVSDNLPAHKSQLLPLVGVLPLISTRTPSPWCLFISRFNTFFSEGDFKSVKEKKNTYNNNNLWH